MNDEKKLVIFLWRKKILRKQFWSQRYWKDIENDIILTKLRSNASLRLNSTGNSPYWGFNNDIVKKFKPRKFLSNNSGFKGIFISLN